MSTTTAPDPSASETSAPLDDAVRLALQRRRESQADVVILVLCTVVIGLSMLITPSNTQLSLFGWDLPGLCVWKNVTGWDCFGCGLTRSFTAMGHGAPVSAFGLHKAGPVLWLLTASQIPWRLRMLWRTRQALTV